MASDAPSRRRERAGAAARTVPAAVTVTLLGLGCFVTACRSTPSPSAEAFCKRIDANRAALAGPGGDPAALAGTLAAYRKVGEVAPVGVRDAWVTVTALVEAAADADLAQPGASDKLAARTLAAKPEIDTITAYTKATCDLDLASGLPVPTTSPAPPVTDATGATVATTRADAPGTLPPAAGAGGTTTTAG